MVHVKNENAPGGTRPEFSVVIPTCGRPEALAACLARLAKGAQTFAGDYEVIVSDDAPPPGAVAELGKLFPWVRWVEGPHRGPAANRNHGARQARGLWLVFTDDDCLPDLNWLAAYAKGRRENPAARVLEGRTYADRPRRSDRETAPLNETGGCLWSCNFAIENALFRELGGFDERFPHATMEDMDFAERLREGGLAFPFIPAAAVCHPWKIFNGPAVSEKHVPALLYFLQLHPARRQHHSLFRYARMLARGFLWDLPRLVLIGKWDLLPQCWHSNCGVFHIVCGLLRRPKATAARPSGPTPWPALE